MTLSTGEEMVDRLPVNLRQLQQFHDINTAVTALAFSEKVVRTAHHGGNLMLRQAGLLPRRDQPFQQDVVSTLELSGTRLS